MTKKLLSIVSVMTLVLCISVSLAGQNRVGWGSVDVRYPRELNENGENLFLKKTLSISAWKGEETYAQLLLYAQNEIKSLRILPVELKSGKTIFPSSAVQTGFVGYVMADEVRKDGKGNCAKRIRTEYDSSYVADPIDYNASCESVQEKSLQPVWVKINVPRDVPAGRYSGNVSVCDGENVIGSIRLDVKVADRVLPEENIFHLDLWQNPYSVARYYDVEPFSKEHFDLMRPIMKQYADAGGKVITTSITHKPWNGQTYDPFESMVTWLKKADGTWWFDYTVFDMWVEFMMSLGVDSQINCYSMITWRLSFQYIDQASNSFEFLAAEPGEPEYEEFWSVMLRSFASHLKEKGWFDKTMIAMDERPMEHMLATVEVIKNADPDFKISFAGNLHEELLDVLNDYCIPITKTYPDGAIERRSAEEKITTYYTCCAEAWPNTYTASKPAEAEWIGWYIASKGLDGYLRWAFNSWPEDPINDSRFTSWAGGDTYLVYPDAISAIRFERLKAGITAYRKIAVLREEFSAAGNKKGLAAIDKALSLFVMPDNDTIKYLTSAVCPEDYAAETINVAKKIIDLL